MPANTRVIIIAVGILAVAAIGYFLYRSPATPTPADVPELLKEVPAANSANSAEAPPSWHEKRVLGRYDNMARAGNLIHGRWANNIKDACVAAVPITSIPDENSWEQPVNVMQCFDGATVLVINLRD